VTASAQPRAAGSGRIPRTVTLIFPGNITFDGTRYFAFRPYARLANAMLDHFERVVVCTQAVAPSSEGFHGVGDLEIDGRVVVEPLPEPPVDQGGILRSSRYQVARVRALLARMRGWDVVYAFIPSYPGAVAYTVARLFGRQPVALYLANDWEEITPYTFRWTGWRRTVFFPPYRALLTRWERWMMGSTPLGITAGRALLAKYGGEGRPVYETVPLLEMSKDDMLRREDVDLRGRVRLLFVGTLTSRKGLPILLAALEALLAEGRDLAVDLVGDGPDRAALEADVAARGLSERVAFHGFMPHGERLFGFYHRAGMFVLPTYSEGFPRVLYEAMGHGVPVVASAVSGIPHLLEDGRHALLVPPGDPRALADAIRRVLDDGPLRRRLIAEGLALVEPIIGRDPAVQFVELFQRHLAERAP
jgi:glycosyltransferase involved in cell wall biosynthesis